jgi:hypothetical protein
MTTSADHIHRTAGYVAQVIQRLDPATVDRMLDRLHDARRGYPSGGDAPTEEREVDEDGNPTANPTRHSDRTGQLATDRRRDQAESDMRALVDAFDAAYRAASRIAFLLDRYAGLHGMRLCAECRRAGRDELVAVGRYTDRCRWHGEARAANDGNDTPLAITRAMHAGQSISDQLIALHPRSDGKSWKLPKRTRRLGVA